MPKPNWFKVIAKEDKKTEILIYEQIGTDWFSNDGVNAKDFADSLKEIPRDQEIEVAVNSPGGNVFDGLAIYHLLQQRKDKVTVRVDGIAASIASIIALSGKELRMPANAMLMIHDPSGIVMGTSEDMIEMADTLEKHADNLADIYAKKTGKTREQMRDLMRAETFMSGKEAKEQGFADTVTDEVSMSASLGRMIGQIPKTKTAIKSGESNTTMNKKKMIAMLAKLGVTVADDATEEQLIAKLEESLNAKAPTPATPPATQPNGNDDIKALRAELEKIQARAEAERVKRVTNDLNAIIVERPHIDAKVWLPRALADETVLNDLRQLPPLRPGTEPIRVVAQDLGNPLLNEYAKMSPGEKRKDFRIQNFAELQRVHREFQPQNVNTIAAPLVPDSLADAVVTVAPNKLAMLSALSTDFGTDPLRPRAKVQVRKASAAGAAQDNPTNFETGDSTLDNIEVVVNQTSRSFHITNNELNQGHRLAHLAEINANVFADALSDKVTALLIAANYPTPLVIGAASAFDSADLPAIYEAAKNFKRRNLVLDGSHLARLLPTDKFKFAFGEAGAYAFDQIAMQNRWTGAVANTVGFVCGPDAIAVASGVPTELPSAEFISQSSVTIESLGLTITTCQWFSRAGRVHWASYDVMFGAAKGDQTQGEILVTA